MTNVANLPGAQRCGLCRLVVTVGHVERLGQRHHRRGGGDDRHIGIGDGGGAVNSAGSLCTADTRDCTTEKDICTRVWAV